MSRRRDTATPSQLERGGAVSPSPARDALQGNLESSLTLNRKKSWFGSARDTLFKALKGDASSRADETEDRMVSIQTEESNFGQHDDASTTPLRPLPERQRTFTPRNAISSLRQHITNSNHRHKRPALADVSGNEMRTSTPVGPESIVMSPTPEDEEDQEVSSKRHTRKASLGRSLVGSIRSFGRKSALSMTTSPTKSTRDEQCSPTKHAAAVPLPSSPMNIPPPPTLQVDLGPSALLSGSLQQDEESEILRITNPRNLADHRPVPTYYTRLPGEGPEDQQASLCKRQSLTPSDLLQLPTDDFGFSIPDDPTIPKTPSGIQTDGTNDEIALFERSVEYKDKAKKKENRSLKKMVSLDAMAEECASSPTAKSPSKLSMGDPRRYKEQMSNTTVKTCPSDMAGITRQVTHLQTPSAGHRYPKSGEWKSEDPFAPSNVIGDLALSRRPSPVRSVKLPLRPKITVQSDESTDPKTFDDSELQTPEGLKDDGIEYLEEARRDSVLSDVATEQTSQLDLVAQEAVAATSTADAKLAVGHSLESRQPLTSTIDPGEYGEFKTQQLFGDLSEPDLPQYRDADSPEKSSHGLSLQRRRSVAQFYQRVSNSQTPSPLRCRPGTTHPADVGDMFWKFNLKDWPELSKNAVGHTVQDTPHESIGTSNESLAGSDDCHTNTSPDRTPNMGDRLDFDIKRSARNMRYNALRDMETTPHHENEAKLPESPRAVPPRPALKIDTSSEFMARNSSELSLANYEEAYSSSGQVSPLKPSTRQSRVGMSSDSIDHELKHAISQHYVFQAAVAGLGITEPYSSSTAIATPSESHPIFCKDSNTMRHPAISPGSNTIWQDMEHGPFDTPTGSVSNTSDQRELSQYQFQTAVAENVLADDTLDDCLEMFHNFNKSQEMLSSDSVQPTEKIENPFTSSPVKEGRGGSSSSPVSPKKAPPARYRNSLRGRK